MQKPVRHKKQKNVIQQEGETDSRAGDFEDEEVVSLGSDASRVERINEEIDKLAPTWTESYNEFKCRKGIQERLEDFKLPDHLEDDAIFQETMEMHRQQLQAWKIVRKEPNGDWNLLS